MNVHCIFDPALNCLTVYMGEDLVGTVTGKEEDPTLTIYGNRDGLRELTFNDLEIIQDNWNAMHEQREWEERRTQISG